MSVLGVLVYIGANLIAAIMIGCMLGSAFVLSSTRFRVAVGLLGLLCVSCFFFGLEVLVVLAHYGADTWLHGLAWIQILQSLALAVVLVLMRLRQVEAGQDAHPRQRRQERTRNGLLHELERQHGGPMAGQR